MFKLFRRPYGKEIGRGGATRAKTVMKEVALTGAGNFVIDVPVSRKVLQNAKYTHGEEFTHMRFVYYLSWRFHLGA